MPEPWCLSVAIDWEPTLQHFEHRMEWLRESDRLHHADSFSVTEDLVGLRWGGGTHEVTASSDGCRGVTATSDASDVINLLEAAIRLAQPQRIRLLIASFQFVVPLAGDYSEVRKSVAVKLLGDLASQMRLTDFAILFDRDDDEFTRQAEFGIVEAKEIPPRLGRTFGRMAAGRSTAAPESYWSRRKDLPAVALFIDGSWRDLALKMTGTGWLQPWWNAVVEDADRAASAIISRVV